MKKICMFDTKPYDKVFFDKLKERYDFEIEYYESKLNKNTAVMARGFDGAVAFVNDVIDEKTINTLNDLGVNILAMRCAGYNNIDFKSAYGKVHVVRVPAYSPYAVAEHAITLLLMINRKVNHAYNRVREYNFSLNGLTGFDLKGKTVGVVGTGKIGRTFIDICKGFGMNIIAYDPYPINGSDIKYVDFSTLCEESDIISLHCPLTKETKHIINKDTISKMKDGVYIINTSRGALIDSEELLKGIKEKKIGGAGLDVYEEEADVFYEDLSTTIIDDDILLGLIAMPNVVVTSHQAYLTNEALFNIAETTLDNLNDYFEEKELKNEICYNCIKKNTCDRKHNKRCF